MSLFVLDFSDIVMSNGLFILAEVIVANSSVHFRTLSDNKWATYYNSLQSLHS